MQWGVAAAGHQYNLHGSLDPGFGSGGKVVTGGPATPARIQNIEHLGPVGLLLLALQYGTISHLDFRKALLETALILRPEPAVVAGALSAAR